MKKDFIVIRDNIVIRVYHTKENLDSQFGIKKALSNSSLDFKDVTLLQVLDNFQYAEGDRIYPYEPEKSRSEVVVNPLFSQGVLNV